MAEALTVGETQLALLLQTTRDFALRQLAEAGGFIPFAAQALVNGDVEFVREAVEGTTEPFGEIFARLRATLTERAGQHAIIAAASAVDILADGASADIPAEFDRAVRIHIEAPGFSRVAIVPFRLEPAEGGRPSLVDGEMLAYDVPAEVFAD